MRISVIGAGAWGTALAVALSQRHQTSLWTRDPDHAEAIRKSRINTRYLPGVSLPAGVEVRSDLRACLSRAELVLIATPTSALREVLRLIASVASDSPVVWACKGFERETAHLPHEIVAIELPARKCAVLSGPSFAQEVARAQPTALILASSDAQFARTMASTLHQTMLRIYYSEDVIGVEIAAAVKNVMAIATGICDGMNLGMNARAALITRGLAEIARLGSHLGGRPETFMGLAGAGDLILTCTGELSRNRKVGLQLAAGESLDEILDRLGHVAEGVYSAREVRRIAADRGVDMPITAAVCEVLFEGKTAANALRELLARDPKLER
ncbi:MAG: NAD(P)-dependent glycerol-3-phosphate dehydrogenase [Betaproteobacteria bacterium]|nr:NAD(P)-dependent glycerol-3-phosphate dehydrogenase [Betaproteobacteria bacterium]